MKIADCGGSIVVKPLRLAQGIFHTITLGTRYPLRSPMDWNGDKTLPTFPGSRKGY